MTDQDPTQRYEPPTSTPQSAAGPTPASAAGAPIAPPPAPVAYAPAADPGLEAVATAPVAGTPKGARNGKARLRWLAALVVTVAIAGTAAAATMLLTSDSGDADVLAYTPADSVVYGELRLDLPGSQQAELAELMTAFPGFDDQAAFPVKLNEALDQLVGRATDGEQSWTGDIDPWFGRRLSVSVGPIPASAEDASSARGLLLASVTDAAKAEAWAAALLADEGATTSTETWNGTTITIITPPAGVSSKMADLSAGYAITGSVLAVGDVESVKAAIDTGGTKGINTVEQFQAAEASVSGDRLAFGYVDSETIADAAEGLAGESMPSLPSVLDELAPAWVASAIRAEDGSFIVDTRMPHVDALGPATVAQSTIPGLLPPTTIAFAEGHDVGEALTRFKDLAASDPELAGGVKELEDTLGIVGGWEAVVGWMGEAGIAVTRDGEDVAGGLVVVPTDADDAQRLLTQLRGFIQLAGAGSGITITDEAYGDATISVIDLGDLGALAGGVTGGAVDLPAGVTLSYAVTDEVLVLGYGTDFTKAVLDARSGESLADSERFSAALAQAGTEHASLFWLDVTAIRDLVEDQVPADSKAEYEADAKPYLQAFDSVIGTFAPGEEIDQGTVIVRVVGQ